MHSILYMWDACITADFEQSSKQLTVSLRLGNLNWELVHQMEEGPTTL